MSILKSTIAGKSNVPITLEWLLNNGWEYRKPKGNKDFKTLLDRTKIYCGSHFLNIGFFIHEQEFKGYKIYWSYKTNASIYKFYINTFADYDKIVKYYNEYRPKERAKLKNKILIQPEIEKESLLWYSGTHEIDEDFYNNLGSSLKVSFHEVDLF